MRTSSDQDREELLKKEERAEDEVIATKRYLSSRLTTGYKRERFSITAAAILIASNFITLIITFFTVRHHQQCPQPLNQPPGGVTPSLAHLVQKPSPHFINVSWYPDEQFFRKHDSDEADSMWRDYDGSLGGYIMISKEEAKLADLDPLRHAYVDRPDLGAVGYPVLPEAIHHMHCVNMIRRNLYYNIEHTRKHCAPPNCEPPELESWRIQHVDHCLEIIRNRVACTADLGIVPFMWYGSNGKLAGDMARMHTCSNYEAVRDFVVEKGVLPGETDGILKPPRGAFITDLRN